MKKFSRSLLVSSIIGVLFFTASTSAFADSLTGTSSIFGAINVATPILDLQIISTSTTTIPVKLLVTSGTLTFGTTSGLTIDVSSTNAVKYISGSLTDLNNALASLSYTRATTGTDTLEVSLVNKGEVFFADNNHLYQYVSDAGTWNAAQTKATLLTKYGVSGYLTTITSQAENDFVAARLADAGWMGASDAAIENDWKWVTGPETGTSFWSGLSGGNTVGGNYANWGTGEPNNAGNEDCAQFLAGGSGKWNDLPCGSTSLPGYVAEFGSGATLPTVTAKNISITTNDIPAVNTFTPLHNATNVSTTNNLTLVFSKVVTKDTGVITIKKVSDNTTVEIIPVASSTVTGSGTNTIIINPVANLDESTAYYVLIANTAFKDGSNNYYTGITASTTWRFTTGDFSGPIITSIVSAPTASTSLITWNTNELASSRLHFGATSVYSSSTVELDISPRVLSHQILLKNLIACSTYKYRIVSRDSSVNAATSSEQSFVTTGCQGSGVPILATSTTVNVAATSTNTLAQSSTTLTVNTPSNFTATSSSVVIQIQSLDSAPVLGSIGKPVALQGAGSIVFDVKAIINSTTILDSFDAPVTITYQYPDSAITTLDESTLWLYHYHNSTWSPLDNCVLTVASNTISCTTPSFSVFSLFGQTQSAPVTMSIADTTTPHGCTDPKAKNYQPFLMSSPSLCIYTDTATVTATSVQITKSATLTAASSTFVVDSLLITPVIPITTNASSSPLLAVRDLKRGMQGEDVRMLQLLLIQEGYAIPAGATSYFIHQTYDALSKYQKDHGIIPSKGYFGILTRTEMKNRGLKNLWW